jgi:hypothetical protein
MLFNFASFSLVLTEGAWRRSGLSVLIGGLGVAFLVAAAFAPMVLACPLLLLPALVHALVLRWLGWRLAPSGPAMPATARQ